ncbi:hypothetical protein BLA17378_03332 [Burkholderia aenigmatica]|uniref:Uncharacterized protein n=1 Tax=Burkholderia aenigmatica TaxID=2015348 RepID=A0ABY6XS54_9BURK|nr:hypothetical protein BLA17378_03332 [Burkholderia aenigmatica]
MPAGQYRKHRVDDPITDSHIVIATGHYAGAAAWHRCRGVDIVADARFVAGGVPHRLSCEGISLCESLGLPARGALLD